MKKPLAAIIAGAISFSTPIYANYSIPELARPKNKNETMERFIDLGVFEFDDLPLPDHEYAPKYELSGRILYRNRVLDIGDLQIILRSASCENKPGLYGYSCDYPFGAILIRREGKSVWPIGLYIDHDGSGRFIREPFDGEVETPGWILEMLK